MDFDQSKIASIVAKATAAADEAGKKWMEAAVAAGPKYAVYEAEVLTGVPIRKTGDLLDLCGNAHVQFKDKRSKIYKAFLRADFVRKSGNGVVEIQHDWVMRQEHGLQMACAQAAKKVLEEHGVTGLSIWQYID